MAAHDGVSSSSSSFGSSSTHDVFLSFRGEDTRNIFTGFLHSALEREGIKVFIDSEGLWGGEEIQTSLLDAIQRSKISIPVFSKGYADSKWCLMELDEIIRCHRSNDQKVLPIFLDVEPRDVRHQTGSFEASFQTHVEIYDAQKIQSWKDALTEVAGKKGYELKQVNGNQPELVKLIVDWALRELSSNHLSDVKNPVGLDARVEDLLSQLKIDSNDVRSMGICGIGGMGKTTIAKALYNQIFKNFEMSCFLANVREEASSGPNGVVSLHEKLTYSVSKREVKICNIDRGQQLIKEKLQGKKVLLILDDVDSYSQLKDLAIDSILFGLGSRIIITTRDEHILYMAKVDGDNIYRPKELNDEQSRQLFSLHAFSSDQPPEDYIQLSRDVIQLAGGLPLTLEVLGSSLFGIREKEVWQSMSQELKRIPHDDVYKKLRISYDKLNNNEKSIFLDATCFFIGWRKETVISFWDACGFNPISAIKKLTQRSLLKFETSDYEENYDVLRMHDQIQAMGRGIVYEESPTEPSKRSRLWSQEEFLEAIEEPEGAQMLEIINIINMTCDINQPLLYRRDFAMMSKLRLLNVQRLIGGVSDFPHLPPNLRWLRWNRLIVPANFYHKKLVHMDLSWSQIREAWTNKPQNENQRFQKLKFLNLQCCDVSHESLDFSWFPYLETLDLGRCRNMVNLHKSIGDLKSLVELDLRAIKIEELPNSICSLSSLKVLNLYRCTSLKNLPESIGDLKSLVKLDLEMTKIEEIPNSIYKLSCLEVLILRGCSSLKNIPESIWDLKSLVKLNLDETKIEEISSSICKLNKLPDLNSSVELVLSDAKIKEVLDGVSLSEKLEEFTVRNCHNLVKLPISWGRMRCLRIIDLAGTRILLPQDDSVILLPSLVKLRIGNNLESSLPPWISGLPHLRHLGLLGYTKLESIPDLPSTLISLDVSGCISLQTLPDLSSLKHLSRLGLTGCKELKEIRFEEMGSLEELYVCGCSTLTDTPKWKIHGQGTLLVDQSQRIDNYSLDKGSVLCVVFEFIENQNVVDIAEENMLIEGQLFDIYLSIIVKIRRHKKHRWTEVEIEDVLIEGVEYTSRKRDIIYAHHFKGFDWFGIPLKPGIDSIEIREIRLSEGKWILTDYKVKFWKVLLESKASEQQQQITNQEEESITTTARRMVADFFNWSDGEELHLVSSPSSLDGKSSYHIFESSYDDGEGSNPVVPQQADEESCTEMIDSHNDLRLGLGLGLPMIDFQCDLELRLGLTDQGGHQAGKVAENPNLSQQVLGLLPERLSRAGKRARLDMDDAGPSGAY